MAGSDSTPNGQEAGSWKMTVLLFPKPILMSVPVSDVLTYKKVQIFLTPLKQRKKKESAVKSNKSS